jgi:dipeptidyl aminopeptidase/acylaminoacyl peptidase
MYRCNKARHLAMLLLCQAGLGTCAAQSLPSLSPWALHSLIANPSARYVLVTRPSDLDYQRVDLLELHPTTNAPVSRTPTPLGCNRVHASAEGTVFCFTRMKPGQPQNYSKPTGYVYAKDFSLRSTLGYQDGFLISRARISADGTFAATTSFVTGHSYMSGPGEFSTATHITAVRAESSPENIQRWSVLRSGVTFMPPDINLWGVTFDPRDSNRFFVTVHSNGTAYLAAGNVAARQIEIVARDVECPSFSPDGKRLAFKKRINRLRWAPAVKDLDSMKETVFSTVKYSVDDQIEWLDNHTLIFEIPPSIFNGRASNDLYTLDVDAEPAVEVLWLADARSPTWVGPRLVR